MTAGIPTSRRLAVLAAYAVAWLVATHLPGSAVATPRVPLLRADHVVHLVGYGLLYALVLWACAGRWAIGAAGFRSLAVVAVLAFAALDEWTQRLVGRTAEWGDLGADAAGVLAVYLVASMPSGLTRWPAGLVTGARVLWLALAPPVALLLVVPLGDRLIATARAWAQMDGPGADKTGHFWLGLGLTWLLAASCPATRARPRMGAGLTVGLMLVAAPLIEWVQWVSEPATGRKAEAGDIAAHHLGVLVAMAGWALAVAALAPLLNRWLDRRGVPTWQQRCGAGRRGDFDPSADARFVGHAAMVSGLTLLSRLTGLARDVVLAKVFGLGMVSDAFTVGFLVPNLFRRLFGEGALTSAFIPHYSELLRRDPALARRFASLCVAALVAGLGAITLVGEALLAWMLGGGGWDERSALAIRLVMVMLPYMPLVCVVALLGGLLQVHRRFGPPAVAPIILNLMVVLFVLWAGAAVLPGEGAGQREVAFLAAGAVVAAGLVQVGFMLIATHRVTRLTRVFDGAWPTLWAMGLMMVPMVLGLAVFQVNAFLDVMIAMWLSPGEVGQVPARPILGLVDHFPMRLGDIAALGWAQRLYQFPLGVFGVAIATAIFPALAGAVVEDGARSAPGERFAPTLREGLRLTVFIGLPASAGLVLVGEPLARLVYQRGNFSVDDARRVSVILLGYAPAIWAYSMTHVLTRAFHALKDARTPLRVALGMVAFNLTLNLLLVWPLGAAGLALSTAVTAALQSVVLAVLIRRRVGAPVDRSVLVSWLRTAGATAVMAVAIGLPVLLTAGRELGDRQNAGLLAGLVVVGGAVYLVAARMLGCEELGLLRRGRR